MTTHQLGQWQTAWLWPEPGVRDWVYRCVHEDVGCDNCQNVDQNECPMFDELVHYALWVCEVEQRRVGKLCTECYQEFQASIV